MSPHHNLFPAVKIKSIVSDVVLGLGPWSLIVLKDQISVLCAVLGFEGQVLANITMYSVEIGA